MNKHESEKEIIGQTLSHKIFLSCTVMRKIFKGRSQKIVKLRPSGLAQIAFLAHQLNISEQYSIATKNEIFRHLRFYTCLHSW